MTALKQIILQVKPTNNSNPTDQATDDNNFNRFNTTFNSSLFWKLSILVFIALILIFI